MRDFHVACGQFEAIAGNKAKNIAIMYAQAQQAARVGADLILFPELALTGYLHVEQITPLAEPLSGSNIISLTACAREFSISLAFGFAEIEQQTGKVYNSLVIVDKQGQIAGVYHKIHLWDSERRWATAGTRCVPFDLEGIRAGAWICYDTRFPELARSVFLNGAVLGLVATAWLGPTDEWELALRARALDNAFFVAGSDIISRDPDLLCRGSSMIVGPHGNVLARAEEGQESVIDCVLDWDDLHRQRTRLPLAKDRRPTSYTDLTRAGTV